MTSLTKNIDGKINSDTNTLKRGTRLIEEKAEKSSQIYSMKRDEVCSPALELFSKISATPLKYFSSNALDSYW